MIEMTHCGRSFSATERYLLWCVDQNKNKYKYQELYIGYCPCQGCEDKKCKHKTVMKWQGIDLFGLEVGDPQSINPDKHEHWRNKIKTDLVGFEDIKKGAQMVSASKRLAGSGYYGYPGLVPV